MTDKVDPSPSSDGQAYMIAQTIKQHGLVGDGWIADSATAYAADHTNSGLTGAPLNAFAKVSESGLDVTFDTGEAFIGGSWVARDTQTTITLDASTTGQQVVVGWDYNAGDTVKIGVPGQSPGATFDAKDPRVNLYTFDTDGSGVTAETDDRQIGASAALGSPALAAGSELERFLMTAVSASTQGTPGDSAGELWRAGSSVSDLLMMVRGAGSDRMNLAWNAYYDAGASAWKYIVGSEPAYRLTFGQGDLRLHVAPGGTADATPTWDHIELDASTGDLLVDGTLTFDNSAGSVPQNAQGGPAGSLSGYPLSASDINDGAGSNLDADLLDGQHASELSSSGGRWTFIENFSDTNGGTDFAYDSGTLGTEYDMYLLEFVWVNHRGDNNELELWLNNDRTTNYRTMSLDGTAEVVTKTADAWQDIAKVESGMMGHGELTIRGSHTPGSDTGTRRWPTLSVDAFGSVDMPIAVGGHFEVEYSSINRIALENKFADATGELNLFGKNL